MRKAVLIFLTIVLASGLAQAQKTDTTSMRVFHFVVKNTDWQSMGVPGSAGYYMAYHYPCSAVTKNVFNHGFVDVQILGTSGGGWYPLPHTYYTGATEQAITFNYNPGYIELRLYGASGKPSDMAGIDEYKLVIIPEPVK